MGMCPVAVRQLVGVWPGRVVSHLASARALVAARRLRAVLARAPAARTDAFARAAVAVGSRHV